MQNWGNSKFQTNQSRRSQNAYIYEMHPQQITQLEMNRNISDNYHGFSYQKIRISGQNAVVMTK